MSTAAATTDEPMDRLLSAGGVEALPEELQGTISTGELRELLTETDDTDELVERLAERVDCEVEAFREAFAEGQALHAEHGSMGAALRNLPDDRAQSNLTGLMLGLLVSGIIAISVFIPVINDAIANANLTGTTATVVGLLPLFAGLLLLVAMASPMMGRL